MIEAGEVTLVSPRQTVDEFARKKERIVRDSGKSPSSSTFQRVKKAVRQFGRYEGKANVLAGSARSDGVLGREWDFVDTRLTVPSLRFHRCAGQECRHRASGSGQPRACKDRGRVWTDATYPTCPFRLVTRWSQTKKARHDIFAKWQ